MAPPRDAPLPSATSRCSEPRTRKAIQQRVDELMAHTSPRYAGLQVRAGVVFSIKAQPPKQQALPVAPSSTDDLATDVDGILFHELGVPSKEVRR